VIAGLRLAVTTFTVLPVRTGVVDRRAAGVAMTLAPLVGAGLGLVLAAVAILLKLATAPPLLTGVVVVAGAALLTRALHLDGLADVLDALGSYADRERALAIMKQPDIGPFGVVGLVLVLLGQVAAVTAISSRSWLAVLAGLVVGVAAGRLAVTAACRRGVPPARQEGLGALVAATTSGWAAVAWFCVLAAAAVPAVPGRPWQGPLALAAGLAVAWLLTRHAVRRLGGITGDVLGAALELATTVTLTTMALGP
jgi:adenosylcobinamide-GDP ribazoletransferase